MANDVFEVLKNFIGFGNPRGRYWFIGIEEAGESDPDRDREVLERYKKKIVPVEPHEIQNNEATKIRADKRFTRIYAYMSYFVLASLGKTANGDACLKYRNDELLQAQGETFQANLYPLGKRSLSHWDDKCVKLTGFSSRKDYYENIENERFKLLRKNWTYYKPAITMCFGTSRWNKFMKLFQIDSETDCKNGDWYRVYDSRIILCPFFIGHKMTNARKEHLGKEIQALLKNLDSPLT